MSDQNNNFPFEALGQEEGLDVAAIFGGAPAGNVNPFDALAAQQAETAALPQTAENTVQLATTVPTEVPAAVPQIAPTAVPPVQAPLTEIISNPIAEAFTQKAAENNQKGLLEKPPRSREFLDALKKSKDKNPSCLVKPRVVGKAKGTAASYKGSFQTVEEARASDKVICIIPSSDGRFYELQKTEMGEFIAPKAKILDFQQVRAGFTPALPSIPLGLIGTITCFFRSLMEKNAEYEALALIYWDTKMQCFFTYVPKQTVRKEHVEADLRDCPYDDDPRYIRYADIHSHNSMEAFFSDEDDQDERGTGIW